MCVMHAQVFYAVAVGCLNSLRDRQWRYTDIVEQYQFMCNELLSKNLE
jgi:hypothetical protein